jgi:hypothetical protein
VIPSPTRVSYSQSTKSAEGSDVSFPNPEKHLEVIKDGGASRAEEEGETISGWCQMGLSQIMEAHRGSPPRTAALYRTLRQMRVKITLELNVTIKSQSQRKYILRKVFARIAAGGLKVRIIPEV